MRQKRSPGPRSNRVKAAGWLLVLALSATACQGALSAAPNVQVAPSQPAEPIIRTELAATDPATVDLASGKPTLVEFFAFW
jgi:hypothetical protein